MGRGDGAFDHTNHPDGIEVHACGGGEAGNEYSLAGDAKSASGFLQGVVHRLPELFQGSPGFDGVCGLELLKGAVNLFQGSVLGRREALVQIVIEKAACPIAEGNPFAAVLRRG